jgi:Chaperone of endosialidase
LLTVVVDETWTVNHGANVMKIVSMLLMIGVVGLTNQGILGAQTYTFPGSVGINTLNPERKLHVEGDFLVSGPESLIYVDRFGGPSSGLAVFSSKNPEPPYIEWMHHRDGGPPVRYGYIQAGDFGSTKEFRFRAENTAKFTFLDGDVGMGTVNPARRLHVEPSEIHSGGVWGGFSFANRDTQTFIDIPRAGERWVWYAQGGTARLWSGGDIFSITPSGNVGIGTMNPNTKLHINGTGIDSNGSTAVVRIVSGNGAQNLLLDGNEIDAIADGLFLNNNTHQNVILANGGGNVGIGTATPAYKFDVAGGAHATSFPTSSDARLKREIRPLTQTLEKLDKIRGISFEWNELYESLGRSTGHREIGVMAQEVEAVFPELVTRWGEESYRAVDYGRLTAVLIEAVKELKARQDIQQQYIVGLEGRLAALEQGKSGNGSPLQLSSLPTVWWLTATIIGLLSASWRRWSA